MTTAQNNEVKKLTPKQERLLIERFNHMLEHGFYDTTLITVCYLQHLHAEKSAEKNIELSSTYTIGMENMVTLLNIPFH